jgi:hypothetical protein
MIGMTFGLLSMPNRADTVGNNFSYECPYITPVVFASVQYGNTDVGSEGFLTSVKYPNTAVLSTQRFYIFFQLITPGFQFCFAAHYTEVLTSTKYLTIIYNKTYFSSLYGFYRKDLSLIGLSPVLTYLTIPSVFGTDYNEKCFFGMYWIDIQGITLNELSFNLASNGVTSLSLTSGNRISLKFLCIMECIPGLFILSNNTCFPCNNSIPHCSLCKTASNCDQC